MGKNECSFLKRWFRSGGNLLDRRGGKVPSATSFPPASTSEIDGEHHAGDFRRRLPREALRPANWIVAPRHPRRTRFPLDTFRFSDSTSRRDLMSCLPSAMRPQGTPRTSKTGYARFRLRGTKRGASAVRLEPLPGSRVQGWTATALPRDGARPSAATLAKLQGPWPTETFAPGLRPDPPLPRGEVVTGGEVLPAREPGPGSGNLRFFGRAGP